MKAITWLASFGVAAVAMTSSALAAPQGWTTDYKAALEQAKKEDKAVLLEFTGSDWCPPCKFMRAEVFSKKDFVDAAKEDFVLVELDFPRKDRKLAEKNRPLAEKYDISGYPTVVLVDAEGKEFSRVVGAKYRTVEEFLEYLKTADSNKDLD